MLNSYIKKFLSTLHKLESIKNKKQHEQRAAIHQHTFSKIYPNLKQDGTKSA